MLCLILGYSLIRPVNIDESYYISTAQNILEGRVLYTDFMFHQMPLSVYLFSIISDFDFWSLISGRLFSVILIFYSGFLLINVAKKKAGSNVVTLFMILFFINSFFIDWAILIRIYSLSVILLSAGIYFYDKYLNNNNQFSNLIFSLLSFVLLVYTKVTFIALYVIFIIFILTLKNNGKKVLFKTLLLSILYSVLPLLIFLLLFGRYLEEFYFNVFTINFITKENIDIAFIPGLIKFLTYFLLPQNLILLMIIVFSGIVYSKFEKFLLLNIISYLLISIFTRILPEYMVSISPIIILLACIRFSKFAVNINTKFSHVSVNRVFTLTIILYIFSVPFGIIHIKNIIEGHELMMNPLQLYSFEKQINGLNGNTVLSSWEGYSIFSEKQPLLKDQYGSAFIYKYVDERDIKKYKISRDNDYISLINERVPDIIIYDHNNSAHLDSMLNIINRNYKRKFSYKSVEVYSK